MIHAIHLPKGRKKLPNFQSEVFHVRCNFSIPVKKREKIPNFVQTCEFWTSVSEFGILTCGFEINSYYYTTMLKCVQITLKMSTNIQRYLNTRKPVRQTDVCQT